MTQRRPPNGKLGCRLHPLSGGFVPSRPWLLSQSVVMTAVMIWSKVARWSWSLGKDNSVFFQSKSEILRWQNSTFQNSFDSRAIWSINYPVTPVSSFAMSLAIDNISAHFTQKPTKKKAGSKITMAPRCLNQKDLKTKVIVCIVL